MKYDIKPFIKWAGGKRQLLPYIRKKVPKSYNNYYEPFLGGGSVLIDLQPKQAVINDINEQLINTYIQIRDNVNNIIKILDDYKQQTKDKDKDFFKYFFNQLKNQYNDKIKKGILDEESASMFIWLNKHCFNGLYRVNKQGLFNVPYNRSITHNIDNDNFLQMSKFLSNNISILNEDFTIALNTVKKNDFVYIDSPFVPISDTANFTSYTKDKFNDADHERLAILFYKLDGLGAKLLLSNNNVAKVRKLYKDYNIETIDIKRSINCDSSKRYSQEVLISNY